MNQNRVSQQNSGSLLSQHNSGQFHQLSQNSGNLKPPHSTGRSSMRASARKRLQVRNDNAAPLAETKHVGLPQHLWATTEIETMPAKEEPEPDVFEEWTFDNDDDILGETDVLAPALTKRNSLDLDWDELGGELEETKRVIKPGQTGHVSQDGNGPGHVDQGHVSQTGSGSGKREPLFKPQSKGLGQGYSHGYGHGYGHHVTPPNAKNTFSGLGAASKPIAKPFSRRPARAMVPSAQLKRDNKDKENDVFQHAPVRTSTPSKIPVKKSATTTPGRATPGRTTTTPIRPTHNFMNPTKSAEAKMRVKTPNKALNTPSKASQASNTPSKASPRPRGESRMESRAESRLGSRFGPRKPSSDTLRPTTADSEKECETRPTTAGSNWSGISDLDRFSFEEEFEES